MINIAIDGHVGSGKSTIAKELAKRLGFEVFDTGAIYRALACEFMAQGLGEPNEKKIERFVQNLSVKVKFEEGRQIVLVNGHDYSDKLRLEQTSVMSGKVSPFPILRQHVLHVQRDYAKTHNVVMEGRDIATEVLPNADFKFFMTASEQVRAQRRFEQLSSKTPAPSFDEVLQDLRERDYRDEHRQHSPLKPAADSIIIDNSFQTMEQTVQQCLSIIRSKEAE